MMMRMLEAGGMTIITDHIRKADVDNPNGYYEFEKVKKIREDASWVADARGKAFKMVSLLLYHLPAGESYRIVFMRRDTEEILASERKMLERLGQEPDLSSDDRMREIFAKHLSHVENWLDQQANMKVLNISYNDVLQDPHGLARRVSSFFGGLLDSAKMAKIVDSRLYRQRKQ
jgi:hypothetical protein